MLTAYLKDHSLEQTYDDLLLPVLAMAEQDRHRDRLDDRRIVFIRRSIRDLTKRWRHRKIDRRETRRRRADSRAVSSDGR